MFRKYEPEWIELSKKLRTYNGPVSRCYESSCIIYSIIINGNKLNVSYIDDLFFGNIYISYVNVDKSSIDITQYIPKTNKILKYIERLYNQQLEDKKIKDKAFVEKQIFDKSLEKTTEESKHPFGAENVWK